MESCLDNKLDALTQQFQNLTIIGQKIEMESQTYHKMSALTVGNQAILPIKAKEILLGIYAVHFEAGWNIWNTCATRNDGRPKASIFVEKEKTDKWKEAEATTYENSSTPQALVLDNIETSLARKLDVERNIVSKEPKTEEITPTPYLFECLRTKPTGKLSRNTGPKTL